MAVRIKALDGLRGLAIFTVLLYHYYALWTPPLSPTNHYPFGDQFAHFPLFRYGYVGVQLFFIISGYVIFMTLERSRSLSDFAYRRWTRLYPAIVLASAGVYLGAQVIPGYEPMPTPRDLVGGLTLIHPVFFDKFLHWQVGQLDGVLWTLYLEVQFYALAGIVYFRARQHVLPILTALALLPEALRLLLLPGHGLVTRLNDYYYFLVFEHLSWFVLGMCAYQLLHDKETRWTRLYAALAALTVLLEPHSAGDWPAKLVVLLVFAATFLWPLLGRVFSHKTWVWLGSVSYPLYLIHQNLGVGILNTFKDYPLGPLAALLPLLVAALMCALAWLIAERWEKPVQRWLKDKGPR